MSQRLSELRADTSSEARTELDSHADTCVVGDNALIIREHERQVSVTGYDGARPKTFKIVDAIVGYTNPYTGATRYLEVNQAILIPGLKHNLLCPLQLRVNEVGVREIPKFLLDDPTDEDHAITIVDGDEKFIIPLQINGVTSCFYTFKPTTHEYETQGVMGDNVLELTYGDPEWDPHDPSFGKREEAMLDEKGRVRDRPAKPPRQLFSVESKMLETMDFVDMLMANRNVSVTSSTKQVLDPADRGQGTQPEEKGLFSNLFDRVCSALSSVTKPVLDAPTLARRWGIGLEAAKNTLKKTTQRAIRTVAHPSISRRFRTNDRQLRYRRIPCDMFTDTFVTEVKSRRGNTCCQVFGTKNGWKRAFPMRAKSEAHEALSLLFQRDGVPVKIIMDGAKEQVMGKFRKKCREAGSHVHQLEPHTPWANFAETCNKELKNGLAREMFPKKIPKRLWDDIAEPLAYYQSFTWNSRFINNGEVPETIISGETPDISAWCQHELWEWVMFRDTAVKFPETKWVLGKYLGPSIDVGPAMTAKLLKANGQVLHRSTYRSLTPEEWNNAKLAKEREAFLVAVEEKYGAPMQAADFAGAEDVEPITLDLYEDDDGEKHCHAKEADIPTPEIGDEYLNAQVSLPHHGQKITGRVKARKRDADGNLQGTRHENPILDTRVYEVEFPDGEVTALAANVIAENMWAQCDMDGTQHLLLEDIVDYRTTEEAVKHADRYVTIRGRQHPRKTTKGVLLCVKWKDGSTTWERLADLKESNPIEVAEFAVSRGLDHEPAFAWWVPHTLKHRNKIIAAVKARVVKKDYMFGIRVPKNYKEAVEIDRENGNTLWQDAIKKEMDAVKVAFRVLDPDEEIPPAYQQIECHLVFTVKMEDFRRKARYVAGGHKTNAPATITYASVIGRETVRIALTLAALNALEVKSADVENAYLTAPNLERIWVILGPEFGPDAGKKALVVRALYGLKSAGASFRNHMADCMAQLGYVPCKADPDLWMKASVRPNDGHKYYTYVLFYVDDCLVISHDATSVLNQIDHFFKMKPGSIGDPDFYLGAKLKETVLPNGVKAWGMSPSKYIQEAVRNVEEFLKKKEMPPLKKRAAGPWPTGYSAELDDTPLLSPEMASYYQSQIGILRWCVELGRIDFITEISTLSSYNAAPREGHLDAIFHVYAYVKNKHNSRMVFDPTYPNVDMSVFKECDWGAFYGDVKEAIPPNAPEPRGKEVVLRLFVDSSHADDLKTRRSRTGYLLYMNMAPISWLSKKQATIETSVFGAEFVAMKLGMEHSRSVRYKLRMMGVEVSEPTYVYGDNMSVIHNTQRPESTLKKKSNSICYHAVRESAAMGEILTGHISTHENPADLATKIIPSGAKRDYLVSLVLYDIADHN